MRDVIVTVVVAIVLAVVFMWVLLGLLTSGWGDHFPGGSASHRTWIDWTFNAWPPSSWTA